MLTVVNGDRVYSLSTLVATYRATLYPHQRWSTSKSYWLNVIAEDLGNDRIENIDADRLVRWALASNRSAQSMRCMLATLGAVMSAGEILWGVKCNPGAPREAQRRLAMQGRVAKPRARNERVSEAEISAIMDEWGASAIPADICLALVDTALRSGELCRIRWDDINLARRTMLVRDRKHPTEKRGNHQLLPLLGRSLPIVAAQPRTRSGPFPFAQENVSAAWRRASRRAGLGHLHVHDLRHEGISRRFEAGWSIPQVAALSGHRSWEMLKRYTHITPQHLLALEEAAE